MEWFRLKIIGFLGWGARIYVKPILGICCHRYLKIIILKVNYYISVQRGYQWIWYNKSLQKFSPHKIKGNTCKNQNQHFHNSEDYSKPCSNLESINATKADESQKKKTKHRNPKHEFYGTLTCSIPLPHQLLNSSWEPTYLSQGKNQQPYSHWRRQNEVRATQWPYS